MYAEFVCSKELNRSSSSTGLSELLELDSNHTPYIGQKQRKIKWQQLLKITV